MKLADNNSFSTIDNKFSTTHHDRDITEVDLIFDWLLPCQAKPDSERATVCQTKLAAFIRIVSRFSKIVSNVFQANGFVVALDRKYFSKDAFNALVFSFTWRNIVLKEGLKESSLNLRQIGHLVTASIATKVTNFCGLESANSTSCH